jgi:uncharacterized protein DUF5615
MRFLADENLPRVLVSALSAAGHDVEWVKTAGPGTGDAEVLAWAVRDRRILVTFDKDFGELIARSPLSPETRDRAAARRCSEIGRKRRSTVQGDLGKDGLGWAFLRHRTRPGSHAAVVEQQHGLALNNPLSL